jgi:hypothetical protein
VDSSSAGLVSPESDEQAIVVIASTDSENATLIEYFMKLLQKLKLG